MTDNSPLLIVKVSQLGDNIVFWPTLERLIGQFGSRIRLLTSPLGAEIFRDLLPVSSVQAVDTFAFLAAWKRPFALVPLARRLATWQCRHALIGNDQGSSARLLALACRIPDRVGIQAPFVRTNICLNHTIRTSFSLPAAEENWVLGSYFSQVVSSPCAPWDRTPPPPNWAARFALGETQARMIIHPGASGAHKCWPIDRYITTANALVQQVRVCWISIAHPRERNLDSSVEVLQNLSLSSLVSEIGRSRLFIGNNSGPMNIASAAGLKGIILNGFSPARWDPYWNAQGFKLFREEQEAKSPYEFADRSACNESVSVDAILEAFHRLW